MALDQCAANTPHQARAPGFVDHACEKHDAARIAVEGRIVVTDTPATADANASISFALAIAKFKRQPRSTQHASAPQLTPCEHPGIRRRRGRCQRRKTFVAQAAVGIAKGTIRAMGRRFFQGIPLSVTSGRSQIDATPFG